MRKIKRWVFFFGISFVILLTLYFLRFSILKMAGNFLIREDELNQVDATFVLSGGSYERAKEAANIYNRGNTPLIIATGGMESPVLKAASMRMVDAELTRKALMKMGVPDSIIRILPRGTSTFEESEEILGYSENSDFKRIIVVSSKFHTRRVKSVFDKKFKKMGIDVLVRGAPPENYDVDEWWKHEEGLIFVNNEYVKMFYYMLKY